jgi:uncharacterized Fe-S radical SAM superfamily protein PflX
MTRQNDLWLQGYKVLSPYQQEVLKRKVTSFKDSIRLLEHKLESVEGKHANMERCFVQCRIDRDSLQSEV